MIHTLTAGGLTLSAESETGRLTFTDSESGQMLVETAALFYPQDDLPAPLRVESGERSVTIFCRSPLTEELRVTAAVAGDHFELSCAFTAASDFTLGRLSLFAPGTRLNLYDAVNFRNRQHTPAQWPELSLGGKGFSTDTYSCDWQFAPHPTMMILRKNERQLFFGALTLPEAYGMYLTAAENAVGEWYLDLGGENDSRLRAGETYRSPVFSLFLDGRGDVYRTVDRYTAQLVSGGHIPDPAEKKRFSWHRAPLYCTWVDQMFLSGEGMAEELRLPQLRLPQLRLPQLRLTGAHLTAQQVLTEDMVRRAADVIRREALPFATILLDDGWQVTRGQWEPHPQRFPHFRALVDDLHAMGFHVMVWWNWAELYDDAQADPAHLIGGGRRNRHGRRMRDYSGVRTRREYLEPLFHTLFSSDPSCYDLDGVKTDFQADKVHADMSPADAAWRGEENYFYRLYGCFFNLMRRYKPDACHLGCAGHPYLAQFIDINRTYDVWGTDIAEHLERARMLRHCAPGCPAAFDFHCFTENLGRYFETARANNCSVEIGNVLATRRDIFSPVKNADDDYYDLLRRMLRAGGY